MHPVPNMALLQPTLAASTMYRASCIHVSFLCSVHYDKCTIIASVLVTIITGDLRVYCFNILLNICMSMRL